MDADGNFQYLEEGFPSLLVSITYSTAFAYCYYLPTGPVVESGIITVTHNPALPVELIFFGYDMPTGQLVWETASEVNTCKFTVQVLTQEWGWHNRYVVPAKGAGTYHMQMPLEPGTTYIRLKVTDYDGSVEYSGVVQVYKKPQQQKVPNPATFEQLNGERAFSPNGQEIGPGYKGLAFVGGYGIIIM